MQETQIILKQEKDNGLVLVADSEENRRSIDHTGELDALKGELDSIKHYLLDQHEENWTEEKRVMKLRRCTMERKTSKEA